MFAVLSVGCRSNSAPHPQSPQTALPVILVSKQSTNISMTALLGGTLKSEHGCLVINTGHAGELTLPIWPEGYKLERTAEPPGYLVLLDGEGRVEGKVGRPIKLGGGYTQEWDASTTAKKKAGVADLERALGQTIPTSCLGDDVYGLWLVGGVESPTT